jgi:hypothetical protein
MASPSDWSDSDQHLSPYTGYILGLGSYQTAVGGELHSRLPNFARKTKHVYRFALSCHKVNKFPKRKQSARSGISFNEPAMKCSQLDMQAELNIMIAFRMPARWCPCRFDSANLPCCGHVAQFNHTEIRLRADREA